MQREEKSKLDYFMDRTDSRLDGIDTKFDDLGDRLDRLWKFGVVAVLLCIVFSPKGEKLLEMLPRLIEIAAAAAIPAPNYIPGH